MNVQKPEKEKMEKPLRERDCNEIAMGLYNHNIGFIFSFGGKIKHLNT